MSERALRDPRARRPDRRARPRRGRADLARRRAGERPAPRRAAAELAPRARCSSRRPTPPTAPSASPRRRPEAELLRAERRRGAASGSSAGELSGERVLRRLRRAAAGDELDAYLWRAEPGTADAEAASCAGMPIAVKDIFCTEGIPTTAGSRILEGYRPPYTATAVRQARPRPGPACSARPTWTSSRWAPRTRTPAYGPVLNPWDRERVPGGSSGGSAAAVAGRLAPWAIGTDTGGSIRQPASLCGIVGLKPTYGAVSRYGMIAFASSLDQCGPLTRDVTDAALLLSVVAGARPLRLDLGRDRGRGRAALRART